LLALVVAAAMPAMTGCTEAERAAFAARGKAHKRQLETTRLRDRATEYWEAVRWNNWQEAAGFLLESEDQIEFLRAHTGQGESHAKMDEIALQYVFIDAETGDSAEIRISWNVVVPSQAKVEQKTTTQHWVKKHGRWWVSSAAAAAEAPKPKEEDDS